MPYQEKQIEKKYFTIGEVAEQLGVATSLLRFWEQEFPDYIKPGRYHKADRKNRKYTLDDIEDVKKIYYLVKTRGFTLAGARQELKKIKMSESTPEMTIEDYKDDYPLIPMNEIDREACEIGIRWACGSGMDWTRDRHKLASDIMNYARRQKVPSETEMTIEDYNNVIRIFTFKSYYPSAKEVEDDLKKLGYKIVKI